LGKGKRKLTGKGKGKRKGEREIRREGEEEEEEEEQTNGEEKEEADREGEEEEEQEQATKETTGQEAYLCREERVGWARVTPLTIWAVTHEDHLYKGVMGSKGFVSCCPAPPQEGPHPESLADAHLKLIIPVGGRL